MRTMQGLALVVALAVVVHGTKGNSQTRSRKVKVSAPPVVTKLDAEVSGFGVTEEKAWTQARNNAVTRSKELLQEHFAGSGWRPPVEQITAEELESRALIQKRGEVKRLEQPDAAWKFEATYRIELNDEYLRKLVNDARQQTVQERHELLARVLGGILAVVLVTAGYLRLEELTRGYATKLLRLASILLLALVGTGLWLTWVWRW